MFAIHGVLCLIVECYSWNSVKYSKGYVLISSRVLLFTIHGFYFFRLCYGLMCSQITESPFLFWVMLPECFWCELTFRAKNFSLSVHDSRYIWHWFTLRLMILYLTYWFVCDLCSCLQITVFNVLTFLFTIHGLIFVFQYLFCGFCSRITASYISTEVMSVHGSR